MYCRFCGAENSDEHQYCKKCGKSLAIAEASSSDNVNLPPKQQDAALDKNTYDHGVICPNCHSGAEFCHPIVKTDITTSGGYSFWDGCCGMILLGPAGLLCGACGQTTTKIKSATWWVCKNCGKEFMATHSAMEQASVSMRSSAIYTAIIGAFLSMDVQTEKPIWIIAILILIILGLWGSIALRIEEVTGRPVEKLLPEHEVTAFWTRIAAYSIISLIVGLLFGLAMSE